MGKARSEFLARAKAVRAFLASLKKLETTKYSRDTYQRASALAASRASAFIMMYNCVEYALRECTSELRQEMVAKVSKFSDLKQHWQFDIVRVHFHDRLAQGGSQHLAFLKDVTEFIPGKVSWKKEGASLPFAGNVDQDALFKLVKLMEYKWRPPKASRGGQDLDLLRRTRNDLAHGNESFEAVGGRYTADDLKERFARIQSFTLAFIEMFERYQAKQLYLR